MRHPVSPATSMAQRLTSWPGGDAEVPRAPVVTTIANCQLCSRARCQSAAAERHARSATWIDNWRHCHCQAAQFASARQFIDPCKRALAFSADKAHMPVMHAHRYVFLKRLPALFVVSRRSAPSWRSGHGPWPNILRSRARVPARAQFFFIVALVLIFSYWHESPTSIKKTSAPANYDNNYYYHIRNAVPYNVMIFCNRQGSRSARAHVSRVAPVAFTLSCRCYQDDIDKYMQALF